MNTKISLLLAMSVSPLMAAVNLSGGTSYGQNFDTLPSAAGSTWTNGTTLPGWFLFRSTTDSPTAVPAAILVNDNDPATAWLAGLYSLGETAGSDRALGTVPTGTLGTFSDILILHNDSASPIQITNVKYTVENWRENSTAGVNETLAFGTRSATTEAALTSSLGSGFTEIPGLSASIVHSGAAGAVNDPPLTVSVDGAPPSLMLIPAGNYLALRWLNANDAGSDAYLGLDDVEIRYQTVATILTGSATNIVRNSQGTPNPADDTVSFNVTLNGLGAVSPSGWVRASAPAGVAGPSSGAYGTAVSFTNIPVNAATQTFLFRDAATASAERAISLIIPPPPAELTTSSGPLGITFQTPALGSSSFARDFDDPPTDLGWTSGLPGLPGNATNGVNSRLEEPSANHFLRINNSRLTAANEFISEPVRIAGLPSVSVAISGAAFTTSGTGFEDAATAPTIANSDRIQCFVQVSANGATWTQIGAPLIDPGTTGPALFEAAKIIDEAGGNLTGMNYSEDVASAFTTLPDPIPFPITRRISFVPGTNQYARLVLLGGNDSASENMLFDNIQFEIARNVVAASASALTVNNQGNNDPSDDTYSFNVVVTNQDPLRSQGWTSNVTLNGNPVSGSYGGAGVVFGPFPVSSSPKSIVLKDKSDPTVTWTLTVPRPLETITGAVVLLSRDDGATLSYEDDTWSARATVTGAYGSTGWKENTTGVTGLYGAATTLGPFPVSAGSQSFVFSDLGNPEIQTALIPLDPPTRPVVGVVNFGAGDTDLLNVPTGDNLAWRAGADPRSSEQNNGGGTVPHVLRSVPVDLTAAPGPVTFSAELQARDTSTGTNFETNDTFRIDLELEKTGGEIVVVPLLTPAQDIGNGAPSTGPNGPPNGVLNGFTGVAGTLNGAAVTVIQDYDANSRRDEFNPDGLASAASPDTTFQWSYQIPEGYVKAAMVVTALNNSAGEFFTVKNVRFATGGTPTRPDADGDGSADEDEEIAGTDAHDPASVFRIRSMDLTPAAGGAPASLAIRIPTVAGRFYQLYSSPDLQTWTREDDGGAASGDGAEQVLDLNIAPGAAAPRKFLRMSVGTTDQFPASVP